jgi:hypothetical protein
VGTPGLASAPATVVALSLAGCGGGYDPAAANNSIVSASSGGSNTSSSSGSSSSSSGSSGSSVSSSSGGGTASIALTWTAPTLNTNGTSLTDLAGYYIYYGTSAGSLSEMINVSGGSVTSYDVRSLVAGATYYFAISAYDSSNNQSALTNTVSAVPSG